MEQIPATIHLVLKDKHAVTGIYAPLYERLQLLHPGWTLVLHDDADARQLVRDYYPQWIAAYDAYPRNIQRTDVFRLIALYRYGGFYLDTDMYLYKPLHDLQQHRIVLAEEKTLDAVSCRQLGHSNALRIANYMIGAAPGQAFIYEAITRAIAGSSQPIGSEHDILESTGPGMLTDLYHEQNRLYTGIHLLKNDQRHCLKKCSKSPSCHFGDYAAHLHQGSWRWQ